MAGCQVLPPSSETSTPATRPPTSLAVPLMVTIDPLVNVAPEVGDVIVDVGAIVSVDLVAGVNVGSRVRGWALWSARMLTVACFMSIEGAGSPVPSTTPSQLSSWLASSP